jgi:hypothetical protein
MSGSVGHTKSPQATGDIHAPFDSTIRFLQSINTPPPTSAPAFGYIVFTATADKLNCTEIAAKLESTISSLVSVNVDVEGAIEMGQVSDNTVLCYFD